MTPAIDITTAQRKTLLTLLRQFIPGVIVWAYGSRVKWTARPSSDLDLVAFTTPAQNPLVSELKDALAESNLPFPVDLHIWDEVPERFHKIIRDEYVVLQEAEGKKQREEMPDKWEETKLGAEVDFLTGFPFKSDRYTDSDESVRLLRGDNIVQGSLRWEGVKKWPASEIGKHEDYQLRDGDVVLAMDRPWIEAGLKYAAISKYDLPCLLVQRTARLRGGHNLDTGFLRYLIGSREFTQHILAVQTGTAVPHISGTQIKDFTFLKPPLTEQRAIAAVLGSLDDKIELNRRMNETLEALAQSLFKSWFVDATQSALPKGWREGSILEVAKLLSGGTPKTEREDYWNGNILWASAKDVSQCGQTFLVTTERTITEKGLEESATQLIPAFCTVVVARGATTGRMTMFGREMAMNQTCYALASTTGTPFALYCLFRHAIDALVQTAHGSVFDTITTSTFAASKVVLPPQQVFDVFEKTVSPIFARILSNIHESRTLAALRDALLPKLLSGELRVPTHS